MTLTECTVSNNSSGGGGSGGTSSLSGGAGASGGLGGGVCSTASLVLIGCTIVDNQTGPGGAGGWAASGQGGSGGPGGCGAGIFANGLLALTNCTVAANFCGQGGAAGPGAWGAYGAGGVGGLGGGICSTGATVVSCTIVSNTVGAGPPGFLGTHQDGSGGGVYAPYGSGFFLNDIIALNSALTNGHGPDAYGTVNSAGHNLIGVTNDSSGFTSPGDLIGSADFPLDPKLGPLAANGGPTLTMALLPGSPALDTGNTSLAPNVDQRGFPRPAGLAADIGAFEYGSVMPTLEINRSDATGLDVVGSGNAGQSCRLLWSPDFSSWVPLATNQIRSEGTVRFHDTFTPGSALRFYRLVMP